MTLVIELREKESTETESVSVNDNGWGKFVTLLKYKPSEQGKHLVKIDKWFPSSKTCSVCGVVKETQSSNAIIDSSR